MCIFEALFCYANIHLLIGYKAEGQTVNLLLYCPIRAKLVAMTLIFSYFKELVCPLHVKN